MTDQNQDFLSNLGTEYSYGFSDPETLLQESKGWTKESSIRSASLKNQTGYANSG